MNCQQVLLLMLSLLLLLTAPENVFLVEDNLALVAVFELNGIINFEMSLHNEVQVKES